MPVQVFDKDNKPIDVSEDEAARGILAGEYGFNAGTSLPVKFNGQLGTVPASALRQAIDSGAEIATNEQLQAAKPPPEKGALDTAKEAVGQAVDLDRQAAGAAAVARGATMGGSDADALDLAYALGGDEWREKAKKKLAEWREKHRVTSGGGEIVGAILPSVLSGGTAAPRALKAAVPLLEEAAPRAIEAIAEEAPAAAKALPAPIEAAAPNALESTNAQGFALRNRAADRIANFGKAVEPPPVEPVVHPAEVVTPIEAPRAPPIEAVAKDVLAETSVGKLAGVAPTAAPMGNALPAQLLTEVGDLVERGVMKALGGEGKTLLGKIAKGAASNAARGGVEGAIIGATDELNEERLGDEKINGQKLLAAMGYGALFGTATGGFLGGAGPLARHVGTELASKAGGMAGEQAFRALNPRKAFINAADRVPGGARGIGEYLLEKKLIQAGDSLEDIAPRVINAKLEKGQEIGAIIDAHDAAGIAGPQLEKIVRGINEEALDRLRVMPTMNEAQINRINGIVSDIAQASQDGQLTFSKAHELRARIDDAVRWNTNPLMPVNETAEALKGARRALEKEIEGASERGGGKLGDAYKQAKTEYRKLKVAADTVEDGLQRKAANRVVSPTDYLAGIGGAVSGHPLGALISTVAHHIIRERGNSTAAVILDKLASLDLVRNAIRKVDMNVKRGVGRAFGESYAPVKIKDRIFAGAENHGDRIEAVARTLSEDHGEQIGRAVAPINEHAPNTSAAFVDSAIKAAAYLRTLLPKGGEDHGGLQPHLHNVADDMSETDKLRFERQFHVVSDPQSILPRLEDGTITPDEVEALKNTNGALYEQIKEEIARKLAATKTPITRELRLSIATFLEDPSFAGPTYAPDYIAAAQEQYAAQPAPPNGAPKKGRGKAPKGVDLKGLGGLHSLSGLSKELDRDFKL